MGLHDDAHGVIVFACAGRFADDRLELVCTPPSPALAGEPGEITLSGARDADGQIAGTWTSSSGNQGAFVLFPDPR